MAVSRKTQKLGKKLQRHCAEVYVDPEETTEEQENNYNVQKMETHTLQKKKEFLKLIWCYMQGPRCQKTESAGQIS